MSDDFDFDFDDEPEVIKRPKRTPKPEKEVAVTTDLQPPRRATSPSIPLSYIIGIILVAFAGWYVWKAEFGNRTTPEEKTKVVSVEMNADIVRYSNGLAEMYKEASNKSANGDFGDIADARDWVKANGPMVRDRTFTNLKSALESINGDQWTNDKAAQVFMEISEGFKQ